MLAYHPAWHAGFIWDDDVYVTNNPLLTAPDGLRRIWFSLDSPSQYFPLTYTTFRIERGFWGLNPAGYHCDNIILHTVNALLVWLLLKRLSIRGAWLAAAIFALHPVEVESVAWITERKNVLSLFFSLLTLLGWFEFVEDRPHRWWRFYAPALVCSALALLAKSTACTLPAVLLLILWLKHKPIHRAQLAQIVPFLLVGAGMGLLTMWWERHHQGTEGRLFSTGLPERILIASHAVWFYAGKLIWPVNLTFSYPRWDINRADLCDYGWLVAGLAAGAAIYFARRLVGRSVAVAALYFVAILSPMLGFIMLYTFRWTYVADHYQYVASIGLIALAATGITRVFGLSGKAGGWLMPLWCGGLLLTLGVLTWRQCGMYADAETLWRTTIERNPNSVMAYQNLGGILLHSGRVDEAIGCLNKALTIQPEDAEIHNNLGYALLKKRRWAEAIIQFRRALAVPPEDVASQYNLGNTHYNLGNALLQTGRVDEAMMEFQKALAANPGFAEANYNLGIYRLQQGQVDEAVVHFQKALATEPDMADARNNLANLAWIMATAPDASQRNGIKAVKLAQQTDQLAGGKDPIMAATLAAAYAEAGQFPEAITTARRAWQLATGQNNAPLADAVAAQLKCYQAGSPFRDNNMQR
jgi:tetratricopeptide (TPR) repeat protein